MRGRFVTALAVATWLAACGTSTTAPDGALLPTSTSDVDAAPAPSTQAPSPPAQTEQDGAAAAPDDTDADGIPDAVEAKIAAAYMPFLSIHPNDACPTHGMVYRLSPHPREPERRMMLWGIVLYDADCGATGHAGDDEAFGVVIDPSKPAPQGILAVRAISHQATPCEHVTTCGSCPGMTACSTAAKNGGDYPVVFASKNKHGNYVAKMTCDLSVICDFGGCALATTPDDTPLVNAGEPSHPLVHDLTTEGFITAANGWKNAALMSFDPWKPGDFGGAGDVSDDLQDDAFVIDTTACP